MKTHTLFLTALLGCLLCTGSLYGQQPDAKNPENENLAVPANWNVRTDKADASVTIGADAESADIFFVNMTPGWHITTGPAAIFWHPQSTAEGTFTASAKIHLFDPKGRNEAFGLFIGGENLDEDDQTYIYFLLRNSGEYLIKKRTGDQTAVIKNWSKAPSMVMYEDSSQSSVPNTLSIEVGSDQVQFWVNGKQVDAFAADGLQTDGIVGLRINHALNVHVEDLSVEY